MSSESAGETTHRDDLEGGELQRLATGAVLVGLDGSPFSLEVARFGLREASRRQSPVVMVSAYADLTQIAVPGGVLPDDEDGLRSEVLESTRTTVDAAVETEGDSAPEPIHVVAQSGSPVDVLVAGSRHADVLVVGHRGLGSLRSRLIGSVGLGCVIHAECSLIVVRPGSIRADVDAG